MDINIFRAEKGGNPDLVRESQRRRYKSVELVDEIIALDLEWRQLQFKADNQRKELTKLSKEVAQIMKTKKEGAEEEAAAIRQKSKELKETIDKTEIEADTKKKELDRLVSRVGNLVHESVPVSNDEVNNATVRTWGEFTVNEAAHKHHHEVLYMIDGYDMKRGLKVAGHRAYFLKGMGARLNLALISYGMDFLMKRGYTVLQTPFFMNKDMMAKTAQLEQFDEELYKVTGEGEDKEKYLIATSEQPISAYHADEWLEPKSLPLRYGGFSTCFRMEAGASGKDTWGIFRVHQFEKVEQFCITAPDKSWEEHEAMLKISEEFYQSLGLPYRVVTIVSGELNNAAAKKYDLEGWFPGFKEFRELVSCSNCTDYQARNLEIRYGIKKQGEREKKYVHMLNSTLCATTRTICCIMENHQTETGVRVPAVLQPYLGGLDFIPFTKPFPTPQEVSAGTQGGAGKGGKGQAQKGKGQEKGKGKGKEQAGSVETVEKKSE